MATHPSILAWGIRGQRSLVGYSPWGRKELDMTKIKLTYHPTYTSKVCRSMFFSIFLGLCHHDCNLMYDVLLPLKEFLYPLVVIFPTLSPRQLLTYCLSTHVPILNILHEWNHNVHGLLCLTFFFLAKCFQVHSCCNMCRTSSFSLLYNILLYAYITF